MRKSENVVICSFKKVQKPPKYKKYVLYTLTENSGGFPCFEATANVDIYTFMSLHDLESLQFCAHC